MDKDLIEEVVRNVYAKDDDDLVRIMKKNHFRIMKENLSDTYMSILIVNKFKNPKYQKLILVNNNILEKERDKEKLERFLVAREYGYYLIQNNDNYNHFSRTINVDENKLLDDIGAALLMPLDKVNNIIKENKNASEYELSLLFENIFNMPYKYSTKRYFDLNMSNMLNNCHNKVKIKE